MLHSVRYDWHVNAAESCSLLSLIASGDNVVPLYVCMSTTETQGLLCVPEVPQRMVVNSVGHPGQL